MNNPDMSDANWIRMPLPADKDDIAALSKRIKRIEDLLVELITLVAKLDAEAPISAEQAAVLAERTSAT